jgi:hypothetical protein
MKRHLYLASGASDLITTVAYGHTMYGTMAHLATHHNQEFSHPFFALHSILAAAAGVDRASSALSSRLNAQLLASTWRRLSSRFVGASPSEGNKPRQATARVWRQALVGQCPEACGVWF